MSLASRNRALQSVSEVLHCFFRRAGALVGKQAGQSFSSLKEGVQQETEYITKRINNGLGYVQSGPRHVQSVLARLQKRIEETRLQALLEVCIASCHSLVLNVQHVTCDIGSRKYIR